MTSFRRRIADRVLTHQWFLAARDRQAGSDAFLSSDAYQPLPQPPGEFRADPFLFEQNGETWVFFECYPFREAKGYIAAGRLERSCDGDFSLSGVQPVLTRSDHLSFPCVFQAESDIWMIPETVESRTVELYRCKTFPYAWERHAILLHDVDAADATLLHHQDRWWMFTAELASLPEAPFRYRLLMYGASSIEGPWTPHPHNPLRIATAGTRSAGQVFVDSFFSTEPRLIWPTQDCTQRYGGGIQFREILELSPTEFRDRVVGSMAPGGAPAWKGLHTYQHSARFEVVDGLQLAFQPRLKAAGLLGKTGRRLFPRPS